MHPGYRNSSPGYHQTYQSIKTSADKAFQQPTMGTWARGGLIPPNAHHLTGEYVTLQKYANDVNDPFIPSGVLPDVAVGGQQEHSIFNTQPPQQRPFHPGNHHRKRGVFIDHEDSGYGGSRVSCTITSPSINAGQDAGQDATGSELPCPQCEGFKAKNKSELRCGRLENWFLSSTTFNITNRILWR
jgi:hypothetical protein